MPRYELVLWADDPKSVFADANELMAETKDLLDSYTLGDVKIVFELAEGRVAELEGIISGNIDQWSEAKDTVADLLANWEEGDITGAVNDLRELFDLNFDGSDDR